MSKVLIISNRLPVRIEKNADGELEYKPSEGGLATGLGSIYKQGNNQWIGWPGISSTSEEQKKLIRENLKEHQMAPVFLTEEEVSDYYLGFSNQSIWPAFHYFIHHILYEEDYWKAYKKVNQKFADAISEYISEDEDTTVWVHDYQLLLLPSLLREKYPKLSIGFFQHIPFPSYEVFRLLPWREELLRGMLGADYISFHTYDDMRHFISSVHRLLGLHYRRNEIDLKNRVVTADSLPMGIDYAKYAESAGSDEALKNLKSYRESLGKNTRLILSVDRLDYSKGIDVRLEAFDKFLETNPQYLEKISLLIVVVPSRDKVPSYQHLKEEIDELVGHINGKYGRVNWQPIHYFYRSFPLPALSALYRMCDIAMITPLRDGMNLVCKEYIASRLDQNGVLILSEMAGSARELSDAILVNPTNQPQMVKALERALEMPESEQRNNIATMQKSLKKYTIFKWVDLFLGNLDKIKAAQENTATRKMRNEQLKVMTSAYFSSHKRLLIFDYDGSLTPVSKNPDDAAPDREIEEILTNLTDDPHNHVAVISGRNPENLDEWLGHLNIDLVAEHGAWREIDGEWQLHPSLNNSKWKEEAWEIMEYFVDQTPGAFIENKRSSLAWHYRKAEKGLGQIRSIELGRRLNYLLDTRSLSVLEGDHVIEIKPQAINKGKLALELYDDLKPDFVMAIGNDRTDEDIFTALPDSAYTIRVGQGNSYARYFIEDHEGVRELLRGFMKKTETKS